MTPDAQYAAALADYDRFKEQQGALAPAQFDEARRESVTEPPDANRNGLALWTALQSPPVPILPPYGTRRREWALRLYDRHPYNTLWQGAVDGLLMRWCATNWVIDGGKILANRYQRVFRGAVSGEWVGWDSWLASVARDYLRFDGGAWIEVVGGGNPRSELVGGVTGLNHLDSYQTFPTGDPEYPCVYFSRLGKFNLMHRSRVIHLIDMPDGDVYNPGYGLCALSRAIAVVERQILQQRYIAMNLNDVPSSGVVIAENVTPEQVQQAYNAMQQRTQNDQPGQPGNVVWIHALNPAFPADLKNFTFSRPPEKFDWNTYVQIDVNQMALAIGEDPQDLWPLSSGSMGSGMQSEVLAKKGKGKMYGHFLQLLERELNSILPESLEFQFKIVDPDEATKEATVAKTWGEALTVIGARLSLDEGRRLLSDNVEQIQKVVTTSAGEYVELPDSDVRPVDAGGVLPNTNPAPPDRQEQPVGAKPVVSATDNTPNASATKGLETDGQRRWFFAHLVGSGGVRLVENVSHAASYRLIDKIRARPSIPNHELKPGQLVVSNLRAFHVDTVKGNDVYGRQIMANGDLGERWKISDVHGEFKPMSQREHDRIIELSSSFRPGQKDYDTTRAQFVANLTDLFQAGSQDDVSRRRAGIVMRAQLNSSGKQARADGLVDGGVTSGLSDADLKAHAAWLIEQSAYVPDFLNSLYKDGLTDAQIDQHSQMWANKSLQAAYYGGLTSADNNGDYEFVGEDGEESCATCRSLKGTKMRLSDWTAKKLLPRVDGENYECKGYNCQHRIVRVETQE